MEVPFFLEIRAIFDRLAGDPRESIFGDRFAEGKSAWHMLEKTIAKAGLERRPKLWTNLRSSRILRAFFNRGGVRGILNDHYSIAKYLSENGGKVIETGTPYFETDIQGLAKVTWQTGFERENAIHDLTSRDYFCTI